MCVRVGDSGRIVIVIFREYGVRSVVLVGFFREFREGFLGFIGRRILRSFKKEVRK